MRNLFHGPMFGKIKTKLLLIRAKGIIWAVNSSISRPHYCISNVIKGKLSRNFHGGMTFFPSAFVKPMKVRACLFLFDKPIKCFSFLFTF